VSGPDIDSDLAVVFARYDTPVMGGGTFKVIGEERSGRNARRPDLRHFLHAEIILRDPADLVRELRELPGKNIWIFGSSGIPLLPPTLHRAKL
jgi:hypothetical protein